MASQIELIKVLRERTGAGLMDCKTALLENANDIEKAVTWLREKGIAKQAKKAGRIAAEGLTGLKVEGDKAVIVEVNCETDFVARNENFINLVKETTEVAYASNATNVEELLEQKNANGVTIASLFDDAGIKIREKLSLRRVVVINKKPEQVFGSYVHMKGQISSVVILNGGDTQLANEMAMCVVSDNPSYASIEEVNQEELAKEKEVQLVAANNDPKFASKPEAIKEKIIEGKVQKHFQDQVFTFQEYVLDPSKTIGQVLKEKNASVVSFCKIQVGEGIEKRQDDFAAEVAAQVSASK